MTNILVTADLHVDQWRRSGRDPFVGVLPELAALDALIIAGNIAHNPSERWPHIFDWLSGVIDPSKVWIVPGNHDYYDWRLDDDDGPRVIAERAEVNFAQKRAVTIGGDRFLCCTLWTDFQRSGDLNGAMLAAQDRLMDYGRIMIGDDREPIGATDVIEVHENHLAWLETELLKPFAGKTFVVTHHAPHPAVAGPIDKLSAGFASDLDAFIRRHQPDAWLFGHTHRHLEVSVGRTLIRNVSLGYPSEGKHPARTAVLWSFRFPDVIS